MAKRALFIGTGYGYVKVVRNGRESDAYSNELANSGGVRCPIVVDCANPRMLFAGTARAGVVRSHDGGETWRAMNDGLTKSEVWWLEQHPITGELWAGVSPAAMFTSADRGEHWVECEQLQRLPRIREWTFPPPPHIPHVKHISLRPDDPADILAAVEEGWLVRSRDGGATWTNLTNGTEFDSHTAYFLPNDPRTLMSTSGQGIYRSEDDGESFTPSDAGLDRRYMAHLAMHLARPEVVYTAAATVPPPGWARPEGADSAVYKSTDTGKSWSRLAGGLPDNLKAAPRAVAGDPEDPDIVYVGLTDGAVWMTEDGGESFHPAAHIGFYGTKDRPAVVTSLRVIVA